MDTKLSITELKAVAYDTLAQIDYLNSKLRKINAEIGKMSNEQKGEPSPELEVKKDGEKKQ